MAKAKRWPENANAARGAAIDAAEGTIDELIDATARLVKGDTDGALSHFKQAIRNQHYIVRTLDNAKQGEAPGPLPGSVKESSKKGG